MPGIPIIGDSRNAARNRPTSLPAEARSLSRMLRLLKSPETASKALIESLATLPVPSDDGHFSALRRVQKEVEMSVKDMKSAGWDCFADRYPEYNMALAVESVLQEPSSFRPFRLENTTNKSPASSCDGSSLEISPVIKRRENSSSLSVSTLETPKRRPPQTSTSPSSARQASIAVVSDTSSVEEYSITVGNDEAQQVTTTEHEEEVDEMQHSKLARHIWALILESVHLQVASRTTTVWGRKKIYEIYQLARSVKDFAAKEVPIIRQRLELEARSILDGILLDCGFCRVYTTLQPLAGCDRNIQALHVQINLGKMFDLQDESNRAPSGEKKKKNGSEFVAILQPGSSLFALTASRAASRSKYTPYVLALLENVLTETTNHCAALKDSKASLEDVAAKRFEDLSGTEPHELLRAARAVAVGEAVGRFAFMASKDQSNPVNDLHKAALDNLLQPTDCMECDKEGLGRVPVGDAEITEVAEKVAAKSHGAAALIASSRGGKTLCLDHSVKEKTSRKRSREQNLGRDRDCPKLQRMCWKWSGETAAASACWMDEDAQTQPNNFEGLPRTEFKCAVVMKGENVLQGMQALVDAGLMDAPLPDFLRDAPALGGTIRVDSGGYFVKTDTPFEGV